MITLLQGDCRDKLKELAANSVHCVVTSPPYYALRDYGVAGQLGLEQSPEEYIQAMVQVFREVKRVLRPDGTCWVNMGDSYSSGLRATQCDPSGNTGRATLAEGGARRVPSGVAKPKDLLMMPSRLALALQADGWWLRSDIIWYKKNPMPESVQGSHLTRHMVTITEYERLSGVPYSGQRAGTIRTCDVPSVPSSEVSGCKATVSAKPQGASDGTAIRGNARAAGETPPILAFLARPGEQGEIRGNPERQSYADQGDPEASSEAGDQSEGRCEASGDETQSEQARPAQTGEQPLSTDGQGQSAEVSRTRETQGRYQSNGDAPDGRRVAGDCEGGEGTVLLLRGEGEADAGSRDTAEQGRPTYGDERRASLRAVQLEEEQPADPAGLVECPGCSRCNNGYIVHLSAGRPTSAHEHVFLLSKRSTYFYDAEAVREEVTGNAHAQGGGIGVKADVPGSGNRANYSAKAAMHNATRDDLPTSRNLRNVWTIATQSFSESHFATFPTALAERCIRAGTSERGCCAQCGAPWVRDSTSKFIPQTDVSEAKGVRGAFDQKPMDASNGWQGIARGTTRTTTLGWSPGCKCEQLCCVSRSKVIDTRNANTKRAMPDLRQDSQTGVKEQATEVLQSAVLSGVPKAKNRQAEGREALPAVQRGVSPLGEDGEVLQPAMLGRGVAGSAGSQVRVVQQGVPPKGGEDPPLLQAMRAAVEREESINNKGLVDNEHGLQTYSTAGPSERDAGRLRDGASPCDGEEARQASDQGRGSPSQERQSLGQSDQQSGIDGEASARRVSQARLSCDVPELPTRVPDAWPCPHCGSHAKWTTPNPVPCVILDCFAGAGTVGLVADRLQRDAVLIELNPAYCEMLRKRITSEAPLFANVVQPQDEDPEDMFQADLLLEAAQ